MPHALEEYLHLTEAQSRLQFMHILHSAPPPSGRQEAFLPVETLLCFGASFRVNGHGYGGANVSRAPTPIPELARLFRRSAGSIIRKMSNLDGSSPNGAKNDVLVALELTRDVPAYLAIYQRVLSGARLAGVDERALPDHHAQVADGGLRSQPLE